MEKLLYIVYYLDESSGEKDFTWVVATNCDNAMKTAIKQYREECGMEENEKLDIKVLDAFMVESGFDYDDKKYNITVKKEARKRNIGTSLINQAQTWATDLNLKGFMLETQDINLGACKFYIKNRFTLGSVDIMLYNNFENRDEKALFWYKKFNI